MANIKFNKSEEIWVQSLVDLMFDLTDEWDYVCAHAAERHLCDLGSAMNRAAYNEEGIHSFFNPDWDEDTIQDRIFMEVVNKDSILRNYLYEGRKEFSFEVVVPAKACGQAVEFAGVDDKGRRLYKKPEVCNQAIVCLYVKKGEDEDGYTVAEELNLQSVYPVNDKVLKKIRNK